MSDQDQNLTSEEQEFLDVLVLNDQVYDTVVAQLDIPEDDFLYHDLVRSMLERRTRDFLVFSIWNNLNKKQLKHLNEYINEKSSAQVSIDRDELLIEFALLYPKIVDKVYEGLSGFFRDFIEKFNEIFGS